jgi:ectoine hydrolase
MAKVADVTVDALNIAIEAAKSGVTCEEVHQVWNTYVKRYGIEKDSRMGYSTGLNYPPDWRNIHFQFAQEIKSCCSRERPFM